MLYAWTVRAGGPSQCKYGLSGYGGSPHTGEMVVRPSYLRDGNCHYWLGRVFILRRLHCICPHINSLWPSYATWCLKSWSPVLHGMACHHFGTKPSRKSMVVIGTPEMYSGKNVFKANYCCRKKKKKKKKKKTKLIMSSQNGSQSAQVLMCRGER